MVLMKKVGVSGANFFDVIVLTILMFITWFVTNAWENRLSAAFLAFSVFALVLYIISATTGLLGRVLDLKKPVWTLGALLSIPVWFLLSRIPSTTPTFSFEQSNVLVHLFGTTFFNIITNVVIVASIESIILVGFLVGIFLRTKTTQTDAGNMQLQRVPRAFSLALASSIVGSLLHYVVALQLSGEQLSFGYILLHQFLSFYVFVLFFFILGLPASISSHMVKNNLAFGNTTTTVVLFAFFLLMDFLSLMRGGVSNTPKLNDRTRRFLS